MRRPRAARVGRGVVLALAMAGLAPGTVALAADGTALADTLPAVPANGLAGLRVAVVSAGDGSDPVAVAVAGTLGELGAELVEGVPSDVDAIILAGDGPDPVLLPAGADPDALVIDLQDGPELAGVVAVRVDPTAADRMGAEMVAKVALEREAGAVGVIGFSPETDPPRMILVDDAIRGVPGGPALSIHSHLSDPAWGLDLGPMVTFGFAPVVLTLDDRATQAIVGIHVDAGKGPADAAVVGIGCAEATRALFAADGRGILRACVEASPEARADAAARVVFASTAGTVPAVVVVPPTARTQP